MSINYSDLQATATRLLTDNGQAVTFIYQSGEVINPATGVVTTQPTPVNVTGFAVVSNYKNSEINQESILASDIKLLTTNLGTEPKTNWVVTVDSKTWRVMQVTPSNPAGTNLMYTCQLRI